MEYRKIPTSYEVYRTILNEHHEQLSVFSSFSAPDGDSFGNPDQARMMTEWGFKTADCPIMGAESTWDIDRANVLIRNNEAHRYWLCLPIDDE